MTIEKIYLSEESETGKSDYSLLNTYVIVRLDNGYKYKAFFITMKSLIDEMQGFWNSEEKIKKYFWTGNTVIVNEISKEDLFPMIDHMIEEGDFQMIFEKI